ncbi:hypothetical protein J3U09_10940 [Gilliamella sp. B2889]|nr:hypothetical protein [Gilliamella sp. B2889]
MRSSFRSNLFRQIFLGVAVLIPFTIHALTSKTSNVIHGNAPYLTFDGGRTRAINTNDLLGITLSDGTQYTPSTNPSSATPIVLPVVGQSFTDIDMFVPTDTDSVALSSLIGPPNNYWGDDDGDSDVTVTGSLSLSIVDNNNRSVSRNAVLTTCNNSAPYRVTLSSTDGVLSTRYGLPPSSTFNASSVTYFVNPKAMPVICFARPSLNFGTDKYAGPAWMWDPDNGFLTQSTDPSRYSQNFPTTGANGFYFDLLISDVNQALSWAPVSQGGITATMTNSTATSVHVILTGPFANEFQQNSVSPDSISTPILPQTFELVGRDSNGNPVVKYGFTLKQWFVHRDNKRGSYPETLSWCDSIGYRLVKVKDLTNAVRTDAVIPSATPPSSTNNFMRHIGAGFLTEWGRMMDFGFRYHWSWTSDTFGSSQFVIDTDYGFVGWINNASFDGLCVYP